MSEAVLQATICPALPITAAKIAGKFRRNHAAHLKMAQNAAVVRYI